METPPLPEDFVAFLRLLNSEGVDYLVVGGIAVVYHGYCRTTGDLDVWVRISRRNAARLVRALEEFGFGVEALSEDLFLKEDQIVQMGVVPVRIDVLTTISGVKYRTCRRDRVIGQIEGVAVPFISLRHLKKNKRASGRFKDLNDLENLP